MSKGNKNTSIEVSGLFSTLLQIAFIILKLCKVIDWSWWWVLAPTWIPIAFALLICGFIIFWINK